ncbi:MAG: AEC family transporter [Clostridia bacterium]|nr:AEC family transporter [Clostridia bacterium]
MEAFIVMFRNVLVFLALAVPGYLLVKLNIIKDKDTPPLSKVLVKVGLPALVFSNSLSMDLKGEATIKLAIVAIVTFIFILLTVILSSLFTKNFGDRSVQVTAKYAMSFSNSGFLGIPLATAVFGVSPVLDYVVVCNVVCCVMLNTLGVYVFTGDKKVISLKRIFLNPTFIFFVLGILINLTGVLTYVPEISLFASHLSGVVTPISMMIVGIKFAEVKPLDIFKSKNMYVVSLVKLLIQPIMAVGLVLIINVFVPFSSAIILGLFMALSMPSPGTTSSFADMYDGDVDGSVIYTLGSTILSVITIPLLYNLLTFII